MAEPPKVVDIKLIVQQKDKGNPVPFPNVAGFRFKRNNNEFSGAVCPDASNDNGEVICRLTCPDNDKDIRLLLLSPRKEQASIVAGRYVPEAVSVDVKQCKIVTKLPLALTYKTLVARAEELRASAPAVFNAVASIEGDAVKLKPFKAASSQLEQLARNTSNRQSIMELGEFAKLYAENKATGSPVPINANAEEYAVGVSSVVLQAQVVDALGGQTGKNLVAISPAPVELNRSLSNVSKALGAKQALNPEEIRLQRSIQSFSKVKAFSF
jgi:hypothetical protein